MKTRNQSRNQNKKDTFQPKWKVSKILGVTRINVLRIVKLYELS